MSEIIYSTTKGSIGKMLGKEHIDAFELSENGFTIITGDEKKEIPFAEVLRLEHADFFKKRPLPYRTVTIVTVDGSEYSLDATPDKEEVSKIFRHLADFDLKGQKPEDYMNLDIVIGSAYGRDIRLVNGEIVMPKKNGEETYPLSNIKSYVFNAVSCDLGLAVKGKFRGFNIFGRWIRNIWLLQQIMESTDIKGKIM